MKPAFNLSSYLPSLVAVALAAGAIGQLTGCGQTGPLYLPPKPKALSTPAQPPQPAQPMQGSSIQEPAPATK
ncbi:MAG: lipoprotein [Burkholderiaceae bacterium]